MNFPVPDRSGEPASGPGDPFMFLLLVLLMIALMAASQACDLVMRGIYIP